MLFSATLGPAIVQLAAQITKDAARIQVEKTTPGPAYTLVTPTGETLASRIEMTLKRKIQRRRLDGIDY